MAERDVARDARCGLHVVDEFAWGVGDFGVGHAGDSAGFGGDCRRYKRRRRDVFGACGGRRMKGRRADVEVEILRTWGAAVLRPYMVWGGHQRESAVELDTLPSWGAACCAPTVAVG